MYRTTRQWVLWGVAAAVANPWLLGDEPKTKSGIVTRPVSAVSGIISGVPADHRLSDAGSLVAYDLTHGVGAAALDVRRTWAGRETLNTHFGPGWSDLNFVRLTLVHANSLLATP